MKIEFASLSHIGQVRQRNEDAVGYAGPQDSTIRDRKGSIFIVADGMGGHRGGEIASHLAVEAIIAAYSASREDDPRRTLEQAFKEANRVIIERSQNDVSLFGMGTTCTALVLRSHEAYLAHVGDSRAYRFREGEIERLTEDHSLVGEMVRSGILSDEDARNHPRRNVITRSIGTQEDLVIDLSNAPLELASGDVFLLCSDGLTSLVGEAELREVLESKSPREACDVLVDLANKSGGKDNITVQVIKVHEAS